MGRDGGSLPHTSHTHTHTHTHRGGWVVEEDDGKGWWITPTQLDGEMQGGLEDGWMERRMMRRWRNRRRRKRRRRDGRVYSR